MFVIKIGPWDGEYDNPDIVGPFETEEEAAQAREDLIGAYDWNDHREEIDVLPLDSIAAYGARA